MRRKKKRKLEANMPNCSHDEFSEVETCPSLVLGCSPVRVKEEESNQEGLWIGGKGRDIETTWRPRLRPSELRRSWGWEFLDQH